MVRATIVMAVLALNFSCVTSKGRISIENRAHEPIARIMILASRQTLEKKDIAQGEKLMERPGRPQRGGSGLEARFWSADRISTHGPGISVVMPLPSTHWLTI